MKKLLYTSALSMCLLQNIYAHEGEKMQDRVSKVESRASISVSKSGFKDYFSGGRSSH